MKTSVGVIFTDREKFLIVHPTRSSRHDIPKGLRDENDPDNESVAVREFAEETGFELKRENLVFLGQHSYLRDKNLVLYCYVVESLPDVSDFSCNSFIDELNIFEVDNYKYISFDEAPNFLTKNMMSVLTPIFKGKQHERHFTRRNSD